jgi:hypothetical protein
LAAEDRGQYQALQRKDDETKKDVCPDMENNAYFCKNF